MTVPGLPSMTEEGRLTMKPVEQWTSGRRLDAFSSCEEARRKYLRLGSEIAKVEDPALRSDLEHTHSKLGIFLTDVLGDGWTEWLTGDADADLRKLASDG